MIFKKKKDINLLNDFEIRWDCFTEVDTGESKFKIAATKHGIFFQGASPYIETMEDLDALAKTISQAWTEHLKMCPKGRIIRGPQDGDSSTPDGSLPS